MVRRATEKDIEGILALLRQVAKVHNGIRPDLFREHTTKYDEEQLKAIIGNDETPIFVFDDGEVRGHSFCKVVNTKGDRVLHDMKMLYIDDICVDEKMRGRHIGKALYDHVVKYAKSVGCESITLNVWEGNEPAWNFYNKMGMSVQKTTMEVKL